MSKPKKVYLVATLLGGGIESPLVDFTVVSRYTSGAVHLAHECARLQLAGVPRVSDASSDELAAIRLAVAPHFVVSAHWNENIAGWVLVLEEGHGKVRSNATARKEFAAKLAKKPCDNNCKPMCDECADSKEEAVTGPAIVGKLIKEGIRCIAVKPSRTAGWEIVLALVDAYEGKAAEFVVWGRDIESGALQSGHYFQTLDTVTLAVFAEVN